MSKPIIFIQVHGRPGIAEAELADAATLGDLQDALTAAGVVLDAETFIFVDESDRNEEGARDRHVEGIKHGCRIHVSRCKRIKTTVHYLDQTTEREFAPGARVRRVKEWAVHAFHLTPKDAAEHVLQICNSSKRPASDTPLHELVENHKCSVCFDLVPEKRVEG